MNTFIIPIGDWSDDGHGKYDQYSVKTRLTLQQMAEAYKAIDDIAQISEIASDYEDSSISDEKLEKLEKAGIVNWKWLGYLNEKAYEDDFENSIRNDEPLYIDDTKSLARLIIQAINLIEHNSIKLVETKHNPVFCNHTVNVPGGLSLPGYGLFD